MSNVYYIHEVDLGEPGRDAEALAYQGASLLLDNFVTGPDGAETEADYIIKMSATGRSMYVMADRHPLEDTVVVVAAANVKHHIPGVTVAASAVTQIAVAAEHHRRGHASALLGEVAVIALQDGIQHIMLSPAPTTSPLYEKLGFETIAADEEDNPLLMAVTSHKLMALVLASAMRRRSRKPMSEWNTYVSTHTEPKY